MNENEIKADNEKRNIEFEKNKALTDNNVLCCQSLLIEHLLTKSIFTLDDVANYYVEGQEDPQNIFEWWVVSEWLADKLKAHGEPVLINQYGEWWGRTTTGQYVYMDSIFTKIREDIHKK